MKSKYFGYFLILFIVQTGLRPYVPLLQIPLIEDIFNIGSIIALIGFFVMKNREKLDTTPKKI